MIRKLLALALFLVLDCAFGQSRKVDLYQDTKTDQLYLSPGPGRRPIGKISIDPSSERKDSKKVELISREQSATVSESSSWYDNVEVNGYFQLRESFSIKRRGADWYHPADRSVDEDEGFFLRRGRIKLKAQPHRDLRITIQPDLSSKPGPGDFSIQLRDLYADYFLDSDQSLRLRFGQMIIPYGFVNLQSSRLRGPFERPEALNSGAEGERDLSLLLLYTPKEIARRFGDLTQNGLKGSGDHGVFALGVYNGQGLNRSDRNGEPHVIGRIAYPFLIGQGTYLEPHLSSYWGRYVPSTSEVSRTSGEIVTPVVPNNGITDYRTAFGVVLHPNPFGVEFEWNFGQGPQLNDELFQITSESVEGGYVMINYRAFLGEQILIPFLRWHRYDGGRKFASNSPDVRVEELNLGSEWLFNEHLKFTGEYSYTWRRTYSLEYPYEDLTDGHRIGLQLQVVY